MIKNFVYELERKFAPAIIRRRLEELCIYIKVTRNQKASIEKC